MRRLLWAGLSLFIVAIFVGQVSAVGVQTSPLGHSISPQDYRDFLRVFAISSEEQQDFAADLAEECNPYSSVIYGGGDDVRGFSSVTNDSTHINLNLTSSVGAGWFIKDIQLYVGADPVPVTVNGGADLSQFPVQDSFATPQSAYAYSFPMPTLTCGASMNVVAHLTMVQLDANNIEIAQESSWLIGPNAFADGNGSYFNYTVCCQAPVEYGCTKRANYWRNNNRYAHKLKKRIPWPISEDTVLCNRTWYTHIQDEGAGDPWLLLAQQWIASNLNVASGASTTPAVDSAMASAETMLWNNCRKIPRQERAAAAEMRMILKSYNIGDIGPGLCTDPESLPKSPVK